MKTIQCIAFAVLLTAMGCRSSRITSTWKAENISPKTYQKIMVLAVIRDSDRSLQQNMENHMVGDLKDLGYNAISSLQVYGPKAFDKMDEEDVINKLKNSGVDAVITIVLLDKQKERKYVPGNIQYSPYSYYFNHFWNYRNTLYTRIYQPGYYVTNTKYFWESNLYELSTQKLIYSVQTQSFDPANSDRLGHEYGQMIVKSIVDHQILKTMQVPVAEP